ncbi:hypothetical protein F8M41_021615 [Gigaspora margarita]|uniref:Uncharacterized protein n=1 Tax=Gigaspora margarita TaxID=4874 RepID=A0A8H4A7P0_GIGMA|nr:hypothetical protein F8M41_001597 [Gigaspora margarita]KAF0492555.1 hypothetical protein F8M41_021615 [Gigaspora margarita]
MKNEKRIFGNPDALSRHLPLVTEGEKTTKTINNLVKEKEKNIILVISTKELAHLEVKYHKSWLQNYGCMNYKINSRIVKENVIKVDPKMEEGTIV